MTCLLVATGKRFDVDAFLEHTSLPISKQFRMGERINPVSTRVSPYSGVTITVSEAPFENLQDQIQDAIVFIESHRSEICRLVSWPGVEEVRLDFAVGWEEDHAHFYYYPVDFIKLLADLGLSLELSRYPSQ